MKKDINLSVIIPVYNTQEIYLMNCLKSVSKINSLNIEILLIDDGSRTEYANFLDRISKSDTRITVVHLTNGGVSKARNKGIEIAKGEYVTFVDSDDVINHAWFESAYFEAKKTDVDAVYGNVVCFCENNEISGIEEKCEFSFISHNDIYKIQCGLLIDGMRGIDPKFEFKLYGNWGKLFKRDIIQNERYIVGMYYGEDQVFNHQLLRHIKTALISSSTAYFLFENRIGSATNTYDPKRLSAVIRFLEELSNVIPDDPQIINAFYLHILNKADNTVFHIGKLEGWNSHSIIVYKKMIDLSLQNDLFMKACKSADLSVIYSLKKKIRLLLVKYRFTCVLATWDKYIVMRKAQKQH